MSKLASSYDVEYFLDVKICSFPLWYYSFTKRRFGMLTMISRLAKIRSIRSLSILVYERDRFIFLSLLKWGSSQPRHPLLNRNQEIDVYIALKQFAWQIKSKLDIFALLLLQSDSRYVVSIRTQLRKHKCEFMPKIYFSNYEILICNQSI